MSGAIMPKLYPHISPVHASSVLYGINQGFSNHNTTLELAKEKKKMSCSVEVACLDLLFSICGPCVPEMIRKNTGYG
jgi:hypothetical protein